MAFLVSGLIDRQSAHKQQMICTQKGRPNTGNAPCFTCIAIWLSDIGLVLFVILAFDTCLFDWEVQSNSVCFFLFWQTKGISYAFFLLHNNDSRHFKHDTTFLCSRNSYCPGFVDAENDISRLFPYTLRFIVWSIARSIGGFTRRCVGWCLEHQNKK